MVEQAGSGSTRFEALFRDYQRPIINYLYRMVGDSGKAEELAQDVFVRAYSALPRLPLDANHRAWLYRIATNLAYDHLRRKRLVQWLPLLDRDQHESGSRESEPGEAQAVQDALGRLPNDHRAALILYSVQGYSTREIAEMLGTSEGAVKTRLSRARERFREMYREENEHGLR
jgi:RNA polymerase sigma-70 factor (ECF subfamily)